MNVVVWVVRIAVAVLSFSGGAYKLLMFDELAKMPATVAVPRAGWGALGAFEIVCAVLLIVPTRATSTAFLTPLAAAALALESFALAALYARYSLQLAATNPLVWVVGMGLMAALVAYWKFEVGSKKLEVRSDREH